MTRGRTHRVGLIVVGLLLILSLSAFNGLATSSHRAVPPAPRAATETVVTASPMTVPHPDVVLPHDGSLTVIQPNGTVSNSSAPISVKGLTFTLTGTLTGFLEDECNGSTVNGAGFLMNPPETQWALAVVNTVGVTAANLTFANTSDGLYAANDADLTIEDGNLSSGSWSAEVAESFHVAVIGDTIYRSSGVLLHEVADALVANDHFDSTVQVGLDVNLSQNVTVQNDDFFGPTLGDGVAAYGSSGINVTGSNFSWDLFGVAEYAVAGSLVEQNEFTKVATALFLQGTTATDAIDDSGTIFGWALAAFDATNSTFTGLSFPAPGFGGFEMAGDSGLTVSDSTLSGAGTNGIAVLSSVNIAVEGTNVSGYHIYGVVANGTIGLRVAGTDVSDGSATSAGSVYLDYAQDANISDSNLSGAVGAGLWANLPTNLTVFGDTFERTGSPSINITNGSQVTLWGNDLTLSGGTGISLLGAEGFLVRNNSAGSAGPGPAGVAIRITNSTSGSILGNVVRDANESLALQNVTSLEIQSNTLSSSREGLSIQDGEHLTVEVNTLTDDNDSFNFSNVLAASVYHNTFESDDGWLLDLSVPEAIAWDAGFPNPGNYWSNHTSPDTMGGPGQTTPVLGGDGIVDTPFVLDAANVDQYPLVTPWAGYWLQFNVTGITIGTTPVWGIVVNGATYTTTGAFVRVQQANSPGSEMNYSALPLVGYYFSTPQLGTFSDARADVYISITFVPKPYTVTFQEAGLDPGTHWSVIIGSTIEQGENTTLLFIEPNGTYNYLPGTTTPGYSVYGGSTGYVVVDGANVTQFIAFIPIDVPSTTSNASAETASAALVNELEVGIGVLIGALVLMAVYTVWTKNKPPRPPPPPVTGTSSAWSENSPPAAGSASAPNGPR